MLETTIHPVATDLPRADQAAGAEREAQQLFQRTLASWVQDLLELRRQGGQGVSWSVGPGFSQAA